jgi:outer membrane lipoprotein-sorting protein
MRIEMQSGSEPHVVVIDRGTMKTWTPARNTFSIVDCNASQLMCRLPVASEYTNPKVAMDILRRQETDGQIRIEVKNPQGPGEAITLVATPTEQPPPGAPARYVLQIDPQTKLLREKEVYWLAGNETKDWKRTEYLDYNQPDLAKFLLEPPAGAKVIDRVDGMGMPQGNLTDAEAAATVARQFFEALIAEDHQEFERLYTGPAVRGWYGQDRKWVRVVSIGTPIPFPPPLGLPTPETPVPPKDTGSRQYRVPYEVEVEETGVSQVIRSVPVERARGPYLPHLRVRPLSSQPDRWVAE